MPNLFPIRARILSAPSTKRLSNLSCLDLRKQIQEASRKNLRMNLLWNQFMYEVCDRVSKYANTPREQKVDKFTPTDISLIFSSFSPLRRNNKQFYNHLLEVFGGDFQAVNFDAENYSVRDIAVLYNSLTKLKVSNELIFDSLNAHVLNKLDNKMSEKVRPRTPQDVSLLLNALLELKQSNTKDIFVKCALILSSRVKYISNPHTLTLLMHCYSRLAYVVADSGDTTPVAATPGDTTPASPTPGDTTLTSNTTLVVNDLEHAAMTDVTASLLARCAELLLEMRPTDVLYFYRAFLNLLFGTGGQKRNVYANIAKLYKLHNQILRLKLEFQTRELITLLQLLTSAHGAVQAYVASRVMAPEAGGPDCGAYDAAALEIYKNAGSIAAEIKDELVYRVKIMSFTDCLGFMRLLDPGDHALDELFRRVAYKLGKEDRWERFDTGDLIAVLNKVADRAEMCASDEAKPLLQALTERLPRYLKLRDLTTLAKAAALLGVKTNFLERKLESIRCRRDCLETEQTVTLFRAAVALGYLDAADDLVELLRGVRDEAQSAELLLDLDVLRANALRKPDAELVQALLANVSDRSKYKELEYVAISNGLGGAAPLCVDALRTQRTHVSGGKPVEFGEALEDFIDSFEEFVASNDPQTKLTRNAVMGGFEFPAALKLTANTVGLLPLFDDFYAPPRRSPRTRKMLKLSKFTQMMLFEKLGIKFLGFDLNWYSRTTDKQTVMAKVLMQAYQRAEKGGKTAACEASATERPDEREEGGAALGRARGATLRGRCRAGPTPETPKPQATNSFERFRTLISARA